MRICDLKEKEVINICDGAVSIRDRDGLVRGDGNAGFFAVWQRGRVLRTNPQAGGKGGSYTEETLPERVVFL